MFSAAATPASLTLNSGLHLKLMASMSLSAMVLFTEFWPDFLWITLVEGASINRALGCHLNGNALFYGHWARTCHPLIDVCHSDAERIGQRGLTAENLTSMCYWFHGPLTIALLQISSKPRYTRRLVWCWHG